MYKLAKATLKLLDVIVILVMTFGSPMSALAQDPVPTPTNPPTIASDKADYSAGSLVTLTGANWQGDATVHIVVDDAVGQTWQHVADAAVDGAGNIQDIFVLPSYFVSTYLVTATGNVTGRHATTTFTDAPAAANLDQCRNGSAAKPNDCTDPSNPATPSGSGWGNANVGASQAHMLEGYSTPFRTVMTDLPTNTTITLVIGYDIRNSGANAYDYLTQYQRLDPHSYFGHPAETVYPTDGVTGFSSNTTTWPIPAPSSVGSPISGQPTASFNSLPDAKRVMTLFGGTLSDVQYVSQGDLNASQSETQIAVTFKVDNSTAVLAWGGHIAQCSVWGLNLDGKCNSAGGISGSPYHMRLVSWTDYPANPKDDLPNLGNTDRSMAAAVVVQPGNLTLAKALTGGPTGYTGPFTINYNCGVGYTGSVSVNAGSSQTVLGIPAGSVCTISETPPTPPTGYSFGTPTFSPSATVTIGAGTTVTVTTNNTLTRDQGYLKITKVFDPLTSGFTGNFDIVYNCGAGDVTVNLAAAASTTVGPFPTDTSCTVSEPTLPTAPTGWTFGAASVSGSPATIVKGDQAAAVSVTVTNTISRDQGKLTIAKTLSNPDGATVPTSFKVDYECGTSITGQVSVAPGSPATVNNIPTGTSCKVTEVAPDPISGYTWGEITYTPAYITITDTTSTFTITVGNSITRDQGYLKISKAFDAKTSGFTGTFEVKYNCGAGDVTVNLAADASTIVGPFGTGTSCTVSEPTLPTAPTGWTFGAPSVSGSPATIVKGDQAAAVVVTVTNSISRDQGYLKISKVFAPLTSGFNGTFAIVYNCGAGDVTVNLAAGDSTTVGPFDTGTSCTVSESTLPIAPAGWTFGAPSVSGSPATIVKGDQAAAVAVTVTNSITRDRGTLEIDKSLSNPDGAAVPASFEIGYDCGLDTNGLALTGTKFVVPGTPQYVHDIPTGNTCTITEVAPTAIPGYTWAAVSYDPQSVVIGTKGGTFTVKAVNAILKDRGNLQLSKSLIGGPAGFTGPFQINYDCGLDTNNTAIKGFKEVVPGMSQYVNDIPTGNTCTVSETLPAAPAGYSFGNPTFSPSATVPITVKGATVEVTTTNQLYQPTISKTAFGTYDEVHDWTLNKSVDPPSQSGFAGETKDFTWKVTVGESVHDENFKVSGQITVVNTNPDNPITVTLSDKLNDGSVASITGCTGGTWASPNLTVPAGGTATCDYSAVPTGRYNLNALAAALPDQVTMSVQYPVTGGPAYFPVTTITNGGALNGNYEGWCVDTDHVIYESTNYTAKVYSSYETLPAGLVAHPENFPLVNWIINQDFVGKPAGGSLGNYSYSDVQYAIWTLIATQTSTAGLYDLNYSRAAQIVTAAQTNGVGFMPTCGDNVAVILQPVGGAQTITIAQVTFASLGVNCADTNVATAVLNGVEFPASAKILWTPNPINPTASLTDNQGPLNETLSGGAEFTVPDSYTCSTDPKPYTGGSYEYTEDNTATLSTVTNPATASTKVTCYAPVVSKTAETYWNRAWSWSITKDYDGSYNLFAGDTVTHGYKVSVTPTKTDNFWGVKGQISVYNYNPDADMTLTSLTDLAGGINGNVTCSGLVVPKAVGSTAGSLVCTYDTGTQNAPNANPFGTTNTATAGFAGADWTGTAQITFSSTPTTEDKPTITVDDDNLTDENWSADRSAASWTYTKDFACSTNPADYTDGKYSYSHTNTAKIIETGQTDTAKVDVTCYWPQIKLTKTGDALSKIGDGVTYSIKLENNTPTAAGLRDLSCTISDTTIGFSKTVTLASGASDTSTKDFTIPAGASDPFDNTASVTCKPVAATAPVVGDNTFSVGDSSKWSTNLFQPAVEIVKSGPLYATSGDVITYTFTINNKSSSDSPNLMLDSVSDNVLGDLQAAALAAGCDNLVYNGTCTFTAKYTVPDAGFQPYTKKNVVTVHYHPAGFPNDITDTDDHTVTVAPRSQLTDTMWCPLPNNQFRLLYRLYAAPNIYLLNGSNPGQFYYNAFYIGEPGSTFTMTMEIPYPFLTQEGAGNPIQVHDGTGLSGSGCYLPNPSLPGYTVTTQAMTPVSSAGNQIITPEDYTTKQPGTTTTVTVSGVVPATGLAYVTIHLDYGLKKTQPWKPTTTFTTNPVTGASIGDMNYAAGFGSGAVTIHGYEVYNFSRTVGGDTSTATPSSYNEIKKFAGFLGFVSDASGSPVASAQVVIYMPDNKTKLTTVYTDADGYYMYAYKHTSKSATYYVKMPAYNKSVPITVKANGFAGVDFVIP